MVKGQVILQKSFKHKLEIHAGVTKFEGYNKNCKNILFKYACLPKYHMQKYDTVLS